MSKETHKIQTIYEKIFSKNHRDLKSYLNAIGDLIEKETLGNIPIGDSKEYLYDLMMDYPKRGGKKFRPALVLLCCELFGGDPNDAVISAIALELFHNFALIHDDIEDKSLLRRGELTLHRKYGTALAINSGDALHSLSHEILLENYPRLGSKMALRIHKHMNKFMQYTFAGQALDIGWVVDNKFPNRNDYREMIIKKTGWYSGKGPCQCGALIAGASKTELDIIGSFGEAIGIGFQIRDDLLNLIEESENEAPRAVSGGYGKERGGDIAEGKRTLITIELLERLSEQDSDRARDILLQSRAKVSNSDIEWFISVAESTGAIAAVSKYCYEHVKSAYSALEKLPNNSSSKLLSEIVKYLTLDRKA